ncbi:hypothetical protein DPMN_132007 [Dreissena polymorpha]|uniref:Uncharacterized protein n=1 Tax=Dreissena polymorpha TaxID=45954 RepID=A0A9D4FQS5_DREPO|nr:hypothetical protein DPMN_131945 [Dreissena polymorpha]KAH3803739.1 hypothetical protein DPMN_132007 [Dreissena polymorpha]
MSGHSHWSYPFLKAQPKVVREVLHPQPRQSSQQSHVTHHPFILNRLKSKTEVLLAEEHRAENNGTDLQLQNPV